MRRRAYISQGVYPIGGLRRRVTAALGIVIFLFNLCAGVALADQGKDESSLNWLFALCTSDGLVKKEIPSDQPANDQHETLPDLHCVFCLPALQGAYVKPETLILPDIDLVTVAATLSFQVQPLGSFYHEHEFEARAPPAV